MSSTDTDLVAYERARQEREQRAAAIIGHLEGALQHSQPNGTLVMLSESVDRLRVLIAEFDECGVKCHEALHLT